MKVTILKNKIKKKNQNVNVNNLSPKKIMEGNLIINKRRKIEIKINDIYIWFEVMEMQIC